MRRLAYIALVPIGALALATLHAQGPQRPATQPLVRVTIPLPPKAPLARVDPALFAGLKYRLVGPSRGGRVTTVTGVPSQPKTFYMGVASGGLFRTDGRRRELGADQRRQDPARVDGLDRRCRFRSEHHLRRHRVGRRAQQRVHRARDLQDDQRRRDLPVRRALQRRAGRRRPDSPDEPGHRVGGGLRRRLQAERRARRLQDQRRREDLAQGALHQRRRRRDGRRTPAGQPGRRLRLDVASGAEALDHHQRLEGRRLLQEHRRRGAFHADHRRPADGPDRQGEPRGDRRQAGSHLRAGRGAAGRRVLPVRRRGTELDDGEQPGLADPAAVLLHDARGRSRPTPTSSTPARKASSSPRTPARPSRRCGRRTATTTTSGSTRTTARR